MELGNSNNAHTLRSKRMRRKYTHDRGATSPERAAGIAAGSDAGDAAYVGETGGAARDADVHADTDAYTSIIRLGMRSEVNRSTTSPASLESAGGPEAMLDLIRRHWDIENGLHHVRDVTFDEDRCRVRTGSGPRVFGSVRNAVIALLRNAGSANIATAVEDLQYHQPSAVRLILYKENCNRLVIHLALLTFGMAKGPAGKCRYVPV